MAYELKLPDIGEGIAEGEIVRWMVKEGEAVQEDQPLVEVMTDKATVEIPSPRTGTIASLHAEEGDVVPVGDVIVKIAVAGESADASASAETTAASAGAAASASAATATQASPAAPAKTGGPVKATPAVRQLAKKLGVTLEGIAGSGPGGAITAKDVEAASAGGSDTAAAPAAEGPETRTPLRGLRRLIAKQMRHSIDTAAHYTFVAECDMTEVAKHRAELKAKAQAKGIKLTYLAYIVKALIEPLRKYPLLNASLDDDAAEIVTKGYYHLGIATDTEEGLTVPVLRDVDKLSLFTIAGEIQRLADAARSGGLKLEELQGGTFTITSTGAKGGVLATPILHHPQVAIMGVHEIKKKPAVVGDQIVARDVGNFSLSLDHRVVDGAVGADFLYDVIARLENPGEWLAEGDIE